MKYSDAKQFIRPFDIIAVKGTEIFSEVISVVENLFLGNGEWTHIAIVLSPELINFKNSIPGQLYVYESTISSKKYPEVEKNKGKLGVQLRNLDVIVTEAFEHGSTLGWCKLEKNPLDKLIGGTGTGTGTGTETNIEYNTRIEALKATLQKFYDDTKNKGYDIFSLLKALISCGCYSQCCQKRSYFCSELITDVYKECGILPKSLDPETIAPVELIADPYGLFKPELILIDSY